MKLFKQLEIITFQKLVFGGLVVMTACSQNHEFVLKHPAFRVTDQKALLDAEDGNVATDLGSDAGASDKQDLVNVCQIGDGGVPLNVNVPKFLAADLVDHGATLSACPTVPADPAGASSSLSGHGTQGSANGTLTGGSGQNGSGTSIIGGGSHNGSGTTIIGGGVHNGSGTTIIGGGTRNGSSSSISGGSSSSSSDSSSQSAPISYDIPIRRDCWQSAANFPTLKNTPNGFGIGATKNSGTWFSSADLTQLKVQARIKAEDLYQKPDVSIQISSAPNSNSNVVACLLGADGSCDLSFTAMNQWRLAPIITGPYNHVPYTIGPHVNAVGQLAAVNGDGSQKKLEVFVANLGTQRSETTASAEQNQLKADYCDSVYSGIMDPLVLDLSGKGILPFSQRRFTYFDLDGNGNKERISSLGAKAGILFLDLNKNGKVDNGKELFGDAMVLKKNGRPAHNGFEALAQYDSNKDGVINKDDTIFSQIKVWTDKNANGISEADEIHTLADFQIEELNLDYLDVTEYDLLGNAVSLKSSFKTSDGQERLMVDLTFMGINE